MQLYLVPNWILGYNWIRVILCSFKWFYLPVFCSVCYSSDMFISAASGLLRHSFTAALWQQLWLAVGTLLWNLGGFSLRWSYSDTNTWAERHLVRSAAWPPTWQSLPAAVCYLTFTHSSPTSAEQQMNHNWPSSWMEIPNIIYFCLMSLQSVFHLHDYVLSYVFVCRRSWLGALLQTPEDCIVDMNPWFL